eukprot:15479967-Alexandrium_andersonii.AAC.1
MLQLWQVPWNPLPTIPLGMPLQTAVVARSREWRSLAFALPQCVQVLIPIPAPIPTGSLPMPARPLPKRAPPAVPPAR